jgi:HKD family nuclease
VDLTTPVAHSSARPVESLDADRAALRSRTIEGRVEVATLTTAGSNSLLPSLRAALDGADEALLCVAFVQKAGVHLLRRPLEQLGGRARLLHTTVFNECATALGMAYELGARIGILNTPSGTYHPKIYVARRGAEIVAVIGSANLTGGLVNNVEAAVLLRGTEVDEPIRTALQFAEDLWAHPKRFLWFPGGEEPPDESFSPELYGSLVAAVQANAPNPRPQSATQLGRRSHTRGALGRDRGLAREKQPAATHPGVDVQAGLGLPAPTREAL